jgi:GT2 family glycosyltransferase
MPEPSVSVVIPTHQRCEPLRRALAALAAQTVDPGAYEVVVAVDRSTDGTVEMLDRFETPYALRRVAADKSGRAAGCNAAIAAAAGEVVIILDDDMRPLPTFLEAHRRHHPPGSRVCVLGAVPVELDADSPRAAHYVKERFDTHMTRLPDPAHRALPRSFYTGNASLRAETIRAISGFDESFDIYGNEDVELALRLRAAGVELDYDPEAAAVQEYGKDFAGLQADTFEKGHSTVRLARRHPEVFGSLRLAFPDDASRPWLAARSILLALTRRVPATSGVVFRVGSLLERIGFWRSPLFYRAALDYAFWAGVGPALDESHDEGELRALAGELRRGPIDLLLHR